MLSGWRLQEQEAHNQEFNSPAVRWFYKYVHKLCQSDHIFNGGLSKISNIMNHYSQHHFFPLTLYTSSSGIHQVINELSITKLKRLQD